MCTPYTTIFLIIAPYSIDTNSRRDAALYCAAVRFDDLLPRKPPRSSPSTHFPRRMNFVLWASFPALPRRLAAE